MMTREDWQFVEEQLRYAHGTVRLVCDGYQLDLQVQMIKDREYAIVPYVNGWMKVSWGLQDCEERRRFFDAVSVRLWKPVHFKGISKSTLKSMNIDMDQRSVHYRAWWTSFKRLQAHLVRNNREISLVMPANESHRMGAAGSDRSEQGTGISC